jgi:hypothetical protein
MSIQLNQHVTPLTEAEATLQDQCSGLALADIEWVLSRYAQYPSRHIDFLLYLDAICQQAARAQAADIPVVVTRPMGDCMTLRDQFAMHAPEWVVAAVGTVGGYSVEATEAYLWADAMLAASKRCGGETTDTRGDGGC